MMETENTRHAEEPRPATAGQGSDEVEALMAAAYPDLTPEERAAVRLDLEALCRVLISVARRRSQSVSGRQLNEVGETR